uniref:Uncharacterized protein n=1 Tax=Noccaea caerulescens TaxID=107243 RepID=A0A1J3EMF6_NOCCA
MNQCKNERLHKEIKKIFPWVLWFIWKNRNNLFFDNQPFDAIHTMGKIIEEVELWFLAQKIEVDWEIDQNETQAKRVKKWRPPPKPWLKCNVGSFWSEEKQMRGMGGF